jgi:plasmid stabilization system protein ParE
VASFQLSGPAVRDLREIHDWIAEDDPAAADRVMLDLREAIGRLVEVPGLGHVREDLSDATLRAWTVHRYVIIYQPDADPLTVVRVLSGYRDIGAIFE